MRRRLSTNLLLWATGALLLTMALLIALRAAFGYFEPMLVRQQSLLGMAEHVANGVQFDTGGEPVSAMVSPDLRRVFDALSLDVFYQVVDEHGRVWLSSDGSTEMLAPASALLPPFSRGFELWRNGQALLATTVPIERPAHRFFVIVARSDRFDTGLQENEDDIAMTAALVSTLIALLVFVSVVFFIVNRLLVRLRVASEAAARIHPENLTTRLAVTGVPAEIVPLMESFNAALERLERGYRVQQEFLATAAHELKTPLTLMRSQVEAGDPTNRTVLLKDLDHMARQVHQLLHLAEVSEARNYQFATVDATAVIFDVIDYLSRLAETRKVSVDFQAEEQPVFVLADRGALFVLVRNLIENALHHAPLQSVVRVNANRRGIRVQDQGPGISPDDLPMLFKRFWRGAHRRDEGAGLGLSICQEIATAHGWTISASNIVVGAEFHVLIEPSDYSDI